MAGFPNAQNNPAGAIPVYVTSGAGAVTVVDHSLAVAAASAAAALPANTARRYLLIQAVTASQVLWVNWSGGTAAPNALGSIKMDAGVTYESGPNVPGNAVSIYCANNCNVTVLEG